MTAKVISVMSHKGGSNKTTTAVCLADAISNINPKSRILICDLDEQSNLKTILGLRIKNSEGGMAGILLENFAPKNVTHTVNENIDMIASGGKAIKEFDRRFNNTPENEKLLVRKMENILEDYDYAIIDNAPSMSLLSVNAVHLSDYIVIPCPLDLLNFVAVKDMMNFLETWGTKIDVANVLGIIPQQFDARRNIDNAIVEDLYGLEDNNLLRDGTVFSPIKQSTNVKTAQVRRKLLSKCFPKSEASENYKTVATEILAKIETMELVKNGAPINSNSVDIARA